MAVIHISRSEAANDFDGLVARASNGDEIFIESNSEVVARLFSVMTANVRHFKLIPGLDIISL